VGGPRPSKRARNLAARDMAASEAAEEAAQAAATVDAAGGAAAAAAASPGSAALAARLLLFVQSMPVQEHLRRQMKSLALAGDACLAGAMVAYEESMDAADLVDTLTVLLEEHLAAQHAAQLAAEEAAAAAAAAAEADVIEAAVAAMDAAGDGPAIASV
jgi:hypothetical protein